MPARKSQKGGARASMATAEMRQVRTLKNGAQGRFQVKNGKRVFRITKGVSADGKSTCRQRKSTRTLSAKAARAALTRHFNNKKFPHVAVLSPWDAKCAVPTDPSYVTLVTAAKVAQSDSTTQD